MRVLLDVSYARRAPYSGTATYLDCLQREFAHQDGLDVVPRANHRRRPPAGGGLGSVRNLLSDAWWTARGLPRAAAESGAELLHHPLPAFTPRCPAPQVVTVHDLAFERLPDQFDRRFRTFAHHAHRAAARAAAAVICPSETTAADIRSLWHIPSDRIVVAPLGPGQPLPAPERTTARESRHFLYVGDDEPRKNLRTLITAYGVYRRRAGAPLELVIAGTARARGEGIVQVPAPSPQQLSGLYRDAVALVHPSLYEGFGMTPLEAMTTGTPVLAARSPGVSEVCGEAALYADPRDPQALAEGMVKLAAEPGLRDELTDAGRARAAQFSWADCAQRHADAYSLAVRA